MNMQGKISILALAAALAAGCAPSQYAGGYDPYQAAAYTGTEDIDTLEHVATLEEPVVMDAKGQPLQPVVYDGIAGARQVHALYADGTAEQLDGGCEPYVRVENGESLMDIAQLCDVSFTQLIDYNPGIDNPYLINVGQIVEVPGGRYKGAGLASASADLADLYTVRDGDTLETIAYRFNVSSASIANLNPGADLKYLAPGQRLALPTAATPGAPTAAPAPTAPASVWEGYDGVARHSPGSGGYDRVTALMPYNLEPIDASHPERGVHVSPRLATNSGVVNAGDRVTVSLDRLAAGTEVTFCQGANLQDLKRCRTTTADASGVASQSFRTRKKRSDMGGVIFRATRDDTGEAYYSERVGVLKVQDPDDILAAEEDEDESEEDSDESLF